jgi:hypothetical protein
MFIFLLILSLFPNSISQTLFGTETFRTRVASQTDLFEKLVVQIVRLLVSWHQLELSGKCEYQSWYLDLMQGCREVENIGGGGRRFFRKFFKIFL